MTKSLSQVVDQRLTAFNLGMTDPMKEYVTGEVVQYVLNYCNQSKLPKELYHLVAKAVGEFASPKEDTQGSGEVNPLDRAKSIKVGDVTVELATQNSGGAKSIDEDLEEVMNDYLTQMNAFRKLKGWR